ncbi:MAG: DUF4446 family protein [Patescibacteria group bacterium]
MQDGLFAQNTLTLVIGGLAVCVAALAILAIRNELRLRKIFKGERTSTIDDVLLSVREELADVDLFRKKTEAVLEEHGRRLRQGIRNIETVRFNPFKGSSGGNQSFASAFVNDEGSGVVISGIYSRDHTAIFAKPIKGGTSEYELSKEERTALTTSLTE